ncbi:MAG: hypothetical protein WD004_08510 [Actinomycetota bacterium]
MGAAPFVQSFARNLEQGEGGVQAFVDAIVRYGDGLRTGKVVLTDRRLLLILPDEEGGEPDIRAFKRRECTVVRTQERDDGGVLVVLKLRDRVLGLCFMDWWRQEGEQLIASLSPEQGGGRSDRRVS